MLSGKCRSGEEMAFGRLSKIESFGSWLDNSDPRDHIFNIEKQAEMYDPDRSYRNKWHPLNRKNFLRSRTFLTLFKVELLLSQIDI